MAQTTITMQFRGITYAVEIEYDEGAEQDYRHVSIKPDGDDADFLYWFQHAPEWVEFDRAIDVAWNEWIGTREAV